MYACTQTPADSLGSDYVALLEGIARRITTGAGISYTDGNILMQAAGALEHAQKALKQEQETARAARLAAIRGPRQRTPAQQQQAQAMDPGIAQWASEFDQFLSTPEGEAWLEEQEAKMADPYFT